MYIARISKPARCKTIDCEDDGSWRKSLEKKGGMKLRFFSPGGWSAKGKFII